MGRKLVGRDEDGNAVDRGAVAPVLAEGRGRGPVVEHVLD